MKPWNEIAGSIVPRGIKLETCIKDSEGTRNVASLIYDKGLWWLSDKSMYVYYTPTHWR